jgi:hypothetical protein
MPKTYAIASGSNAVLAGTQHGVAAGSYSPNQASGAVLVAGIGEWAEEPIKEGTFGCSATTKKGDPCKARPVTGSDLCVGHTKQAVS